MVSEAFVVAERFNTCWAISRVDSWTTRDILHAVLHWSPTNTAFSNVGSSKLDQDIHNMDQAYALNVTGGRIEIQKQSSGIMS